MDVSHYTYPVLHNTVAHTYKYVLFRISLLHMHTILYCDNECILVTPHPSVTYCYHSLGLVVCLVHAISAFEDVQSNVICVTKGGGSNFPTQFFYVTLEWPPTCSTPLKLNLGKFALDLCKNLPT